MKVSIHITRIPTNGSAVRIT